jgi:hypothetical protein
VEFFPSFGEEIRLLHLKDFLKYVSGMYLKQPLTLPQHKIVVAYHTSNHGLAIKIGWWSIIPIRRDKSFGNLKSEIAYALCDELQSARLLRFQPPFWGMLYTCTFQFLNFKTKAGNELVLHICNICGGIGGGIEIERGEFE